MCKCRSSVYGVPMQHIVLFMGKSTFLENTLIANLVCLLVDFIFNVQQRVCRLKSNIPNFIDGFLNIIRFTDISL